ncbi:MAG: thioredoxin [Gammaproteobacteria bacterium]|nr:thioredoxin [Gammaproteobacteria bacterium]
MANVKAISEVTGNTFAREVLEASTQLPVLVDFWADWCQPCKQLAPLLEIIAKEQAGKLKLVKVNTDQERQLATQFGIRSLPTVALFKGGKMVDQFSGLIPKTAIDEFLARHLLRESDVLLQQAQAALAAGDQATAISILKTALAKEPENYNIHPYLASLLMATHEYQQAEELLNSLPANVQMSDEIVGIRASMKFLDIVHDAPDAVAIQQMVDQDKNNLQALYQLSAHQVIAGEYETAMEQLLDIVRRDRKFGDDAGRKALLDVFTILGNSSELVKRYRTRLAGLLN